MDVATTEKNGVAWSGGKGDAYSEREGGVARTESGSAVVGSCGVARSESGGAVSGVGGISWSRSGGAESGRFGLARTLVGSAVVGSQGVAWVSGAGEAHSGDCGVTICGVGGVGSVGSGGVLIFRRSDGGLVVGSGLSAGVLYRLVEGQIVEA